MQCTGTESRLLDCTYTPYSSNSHDDDAGIRCAGNNTKIGELFGLMVYYHCKNKLSENCTTKEGVRLIGGQKEWEGTIQICFGRVWGTVCDNYWDSTDAQVVCKQLGFAAKGTNLQ